MATTVIEAFNEFLREQITLDPDSTDTARRSRDWLMERIHEFPAADSSFPQLNSEKDIFFGSFERKTKNRPLDDIDIMVGLHAAGATYEEYGDTVYVSTENLNSALYSLRSDNSKNINSKRVINKFVSKLSSIPQYRNAEMGRRGEAAVLNLRSYDWAYDLVPCFFTTPEIDGRAFYLIPDGSGNWKKTDPRLDRERVQRLVTTRGRIILDVIRLVKFWNQRATMPTLPSYLIENMVLDYYENAICGNYPDIEFMGVINHIRTAINSPVYDPKGIQGDINEVHWLDRNSIANRCVEDYATAVAGREFESVKNYRSSINKWRDIFGPEFPHFG